ncbi:MAG: ABC transporter permease subunit [Comamonadaceae bacterium]|nr:ABC transporter permease subunit [Comamonadaceae bacterium]
MAQASMVVKDPAARPRLWGAVVALVALWPLFQGAGVQPAALFDAENLRVIGGFLVHFLPPETGAEFAVYLWQATLETLAIATIGLLLAFVLAVPLSYWATSAVREQARQNPVARAVMTVLREDGSAARALLRTGSPRALALLYGLLPLASKELVSYTVYRWECAIRASVVMGFVGAGGLGQLMDQAMKMLNGGEASAILLVFVALVLLADALSNWLRNSLETQPAARPSSWGVRSVGVLLAMVAGIGASWQLLGMDWLALFTGEAVSAMGEFVSGFFPPDTSRAWLWAVLVGVGETLAISVVGTLLAAVAALLLALPRFRAPWNVVLNLLRSVPELVWATLTALAVGLGPFAGVLALALHTTGVLGRLYAEALENAPAKPADALRMAGSPRVLAFLYGTLPGAAPQLLAYTLYRWEMNIRMAAILGFVGAGGLGQLLYFKLSLFHYAEASTVIMAMLLLSMAVDQASAWLRRRML